MLYLPLLVFTLFSALGYVHAQSNDSVKFFIPPKVPTADFTTCSYSWEGVVHEPKNASFELMVGKADVNNLINSKINSGFTDFGWQVRAATPPGDYHIRMNATIYESAIDGNPIGPFTQRSQTFPVVQNKPFACTVPAWEPVRSVSDPGFGPLRVDLPNGGDVYYLSNDTHTLASISSSISVVDVDFKRQDASMTLELVNTRTGASAGVQKLTLELENFKVEAGPWKACHIPSCPRKLFGAWKRQLFGILRGVLYCLAGALWRPRGWKFYYIWWIKWICRWIWGRSTHLARVLSVPPLRGSSYRSIGYDAVVTTEILTCALGTIACFRWLALFISGGEIPKQDSYRVIMRENSFLGPRTARQREEWFKLRCRITPARDIPVLMQGCVLTLVSPVQR
ncbi:hypothetical protein C8J57DRAFT_1657041 [Mycena rebaudengoi]|nr:hypothetical protein C8J57DRAFT_1657041 [Mycena rebaudengoi]